MAKKLLIRLKPGKKFDLKITFDGGMWVGECAPLSIYAFHENLSKLGAELEEQLDFLWKEFVLNQSTELTESASRLRKRLLNLFEERSAT